MSDPLEMDLHEGPLERRITELEEQIKHIPELYAILKVFQDSIKDLDSRLVYLEEQESSRARADHQREEHLDLENAEGLSRV